MSRAKKNWISLLKQYAFFWRLDFALIRSCGNALRNDTSDKVESNYQVPHSFCSHQCDESQLILGSGTIRNHSNASQKSSIRYFDNYRGEPVSSQILNDRILSKIIHVLLCTYYRGREILLNSFYIFPGCFFRRNTLLLSIFENKTSDPFCSVF